MLRQSKQKYYSDNLFKNRKNVKRTWEILKEAANLIGMVTYQNIRQPAMIPSIVGTLVAGFNEDGTTRDFARIVEDLAGKWDNLTNAQQQNLAVQMAGRYQITR
jgi:hypothetical protein